MAVEKRRIFFPVLIPVIKEHSKANAFVSIISTNSTNTAFFYKMQSNPIKP